VPVESLLVEVTVIAVGFGLLVNRELAEGIVRGAELTVVLGVSGLGLAEVFGLRVVAVSVVLSAEVFGFVAHCRLDLVMLRGKVMGIRLGVLG
jgi:hypothetical protein